MKDLQTVTLLETPITTASESDILEYIATRLKEKDVKIFITTPNPEIVVYAHHHSSFKSILQSSTIALPDGVGIVVAAKILRLKISKRITGVDFVESFCEKFSKSNVSIGLLGGRHGVAEEAAKRLKQKYSGLSVVYVAEDFDEDELKKNPPDVLFVALGHPKQEEWIAEHLGKLPVKMMMGVGGTFDYISGKILRAPKFVRMIGFEWVYRLFRQPWRAKRQLALLEFMGLVLKSFFSQDTQRIHAH